MPVRVSENAIVDPRAELEHGVEVGPYCLIGPDVVIGRDTRLLSHVTINGPAEIGRDNVFHPHVVVGGDPQDLSYNGERTRVIVGDHNVLRESVTVNRGTAKEEGLTTIGDHCFLMAGCHVAHDCRLGDRIVMANAALLGGHVHIHDDATISGAVAIHHFTTVGSYSFIGGLSRVLHDVPPYMLVEGIPTRPRCINLVALRRNQFPDEVIEALHEAHRLLYRSHVGLDHAREILRSQSQLVPAVNHLLSFIQNQQEGRHGRGRERRRAA
jgi:UDP-N-acetylglucosamine acyltransferase